MRRNFILEGDKTTAGGVVIEGLAPSDVIEGRGVSFNGAMISCPACKSTGKISCIGPRWPFTLPNGQQAALENDLCICKCSRPPKLVASQIFSGQEFDSQQLEGMGFGANGKPLPEEAAPAAGTDSQAGTQGLPPHTLEIRIVDADEQSPSAEPLTLFDESGAEHKVTAASGAARVNDFKPGAARFIQPQRTEESA